MNVNLKSVYYSILQENMSGLTGEYQLFEAMYAVHEMLFRINNLRHWAKEGYMNYLLCIKIAGQIVPFKPTEKEAEEEIKSLPDVLKYKNAISVLRKNSGIPGVDKWLGEVDKEYPESKPKPKVKPIEVKKEKLPQNARVKIAEPVISEEPKYVETPTQPPAPVKKELWVKLGPEGENWLDSRIGYGPGSKSTDLLTLLREKKAIKVGGLSSYLMVVDEGFLKELERRGAVQLYEKEVT